MKLRITSGSLRGRLLCAPKGDQTRPTSEKVRQSFFNAYRHLIEKSSFLDIFAGSGAMGFEALSNGASHATFIENHRLAQQAIEQNIETLELQSQTLLLKKEALLALEELHKKSTSFDIIYIDPPYAHHQIKEKVLLFLDGSMLLHPESILFLEENVHHHSHPEKLQLQNIIFEKTKEIGDTLIHVFHYASS